MPCLRMSVNRLREGMMIKEDVFSKTGAVIVPDGAVVTKDVVALLTRHFVDSVMVEYPTGRKERPEQQEQLTRVHNRLKATIQKLKEINEKNQMLIGDAMEMVDFNLKMLQGLKSAPQTANYSKNAYCTGSSLGVLQGGFDAKQ